MIAKEIEKEYEYALSYFYDAMEKRLYLEILEPIKNTINIFCKKVGYSLRKLKNYKDERLWVRVHEKGN